MPRRKIPRALLEAARRLRQEQTPAEAELWELLRNRGTNATRFKRQTVIGSYIADFYCPAYRLIIELDGRIHTVPGVQQNDQIRQTNLESKGYMVLRFTNDQLQFHLPEVIGQIVDYIETANRSE